MKTFERRVRHLSFAFFLLYAVAGVRYFELQVIHGDVYAEKSLERQQIREVIPCRRGSLFDRNGRLLVTDQRAFHVAFRPGYFMRGSALGSLALLSTLIGPESESEADERLWPGSPADIAFSVRARDLDVRGERGATAVAALRRIAEWVELAPEPMANFLGTDSPSFGEALGPKAVLRVRFRAVEEYDVLKRLVLVALAANRPSFSTLRDASDGLLGGLLAARRGDIQSIPSESLRRDAERALAALFDLGATDVRARLRRANRFDSLEAALSVAGGEPLRERARRVLAEEDRELAEVAAILGIPAGDLLARLDVESLNADADVRASLRFRHEKQGASSPSDRELERRYKTASDDFLFRERIVVRDVGADPALRVAVLPRSVAGLSVREASARRSLLPIAPHLLGFTAEKDPSGKVGRAGLEGALDARLRGESGREVVQRDRRGREIEVVEREDPVPGEDVVLTLDAAIQQAAEAALVSHRGGAIVVDVRNGEVLAAASSPGYSVDTLRRDFGSIAADREGNPLLSRVTRRSRQPYPGSTFKIVVALAGLETGVITPTTRFQCSGFMHRKGEFTCLGEHGAVDLKEALAKSCNVYFYYVGEKLGGRVLAEWAGLFGFGAPTGLEIGDDPGRLLHHGASAWTTADSRFLAIGQVNVEATVAQVARMTCAVARGGDLPSLRVVRSIGGRPEPWPPPSRIAVAPAHWVTVRDALRDVVTRGTAANAGLTVFDAAGKSGTAQTGRRDGTSPDHAWFTGYAPADSPEVVVTVLLEFEGRHGGDAAAPVAAEILRHVFGDDGRR